MRLAVFALCFVGLGISFYPLTPRASRLFILVGVSVLIPLILVYSGFSSWVFRGKVQAGAH